MKLIIVFIIATLIGCKNNAHPEQEPSVMVPSNEGIVTASLQTPVSNSGATAKRRFNPEILPHLKRMAILLKSGTVTFYNWSDNCSCNVGLMAQMCLNKTGKEMQMEWSKMADFREYAKQQHEKDKNYQEGAWSNAVNYYCGITGRPVSNIIGDLMNKGFSSLDISGLEFLSDSYILSKTNIAVESQYYAKKENVIKYLDAWIDIMEH